MCYSKHIASYKREDKRRRGRHSACAHLNSLPSSSLGPSFFLFCSLRPPSCHLWTALFFRFSALQAHLVIGNLVEPGLFGETFELSPVVVLLSLAFWGSLWVRFSASPRPGPFLFVRPSIDQCSNSQYNVPPLPASPSCSSPHEYGPPSYPATIHFSKSTKQFEPVAVQEGLGWWCVLSKRLLHVHVMDAPEN